MLCADRMMKSLRTKFRDIRDEFESTGAGIVPIDSETSSNLHREYPAHIS